MWLKKPDYLLNELIISAFKQLRLSIPCIARFEFHLIRGTSEIHHLQKAIEESYWLFGECKRSICFSKRKREKISGQWDRQL